MRYPKVAMWIKWHNHWYIPRFVWYWATGKVDAYHSRKIDFPPPSNFMKP